MNCTFRRLRRAAAAIMLLPVLAVPAAAEDPLPSLDAAGAIAARIEGAASVTPATLALLLRHPDVRKVVEQIVADMLRRDPTLLSSIVAPPPAGVPAAPVIPAEARERFLADDLPRLGPADATMRIAIVSDYACAFCRRQEAALEALSASGKAFQVVHVHWPVLGPWSERAARVALAAPTGRYAEVHRILMRLQPGDTDSLKALVTELGLTEADLNAPAVNDRLSRNKALAKEFGLRGTPVLVSRGSSHYGAMGDKETRDFLDAAGR